jgi:hypothetical protein
MSAEHFDCCTNFGNASKIMLFAQSFVIYHNMNFVLFNCLGFVKFVVQSFY